VGAVAGAEKVPLPLSVHERRPLFPPKRPIVGDREERRDFFPKNLARKIPGFNNNVLVKSHWNDGFVKSSPAKGGTMRAKTEE